MPLIVLAAALVVASVVWQPGPPMPSARTEVAAAVLGGEIVVLGGFVGSGANSRRADALDVATGSWRRLDDLPVSVDHAAAAAARGRVWVVGGYGADRRPLRAAWAWDGRSWRRAPRPPEPRAAAAAAVAAGRLHVVGGVGPDGLARTTLVLDLATLRWSTIPGPQPREHLAAVAAGGLVFALGGRTGGLGTNVATVEALDPRIGSWSLRPPVPHPRGGTGAAAIAGRIVSVGGEELGGTIASVYAFDIATRRWTRLPDLARPRHGLGVVAAAGRVWAVAGGPEPGLTVSGAVESLAIPPRGR